MKEKLISLIAQNCDWHKQVNDKFMGECESRLYKLEQMLPHGSGIDSGCEIDVANSSSDKVIIHFGYHHMDEWGAYDKGGAYWGFPSNLRVKYTKDLSYIEFYRK